VAPDSPAGALKQAQMGMPFAFSSSAGHLVQRCRIEEFDFSAHASREDLLEFVLRVEPRVVLLGHGEAPARAWFEAQLKERSPRIQVIQPLLGTEHIF
jgi:Cft2 family RNA processing exonuclease